MKNYINKTISNLIALPILIIAGGATQAQSLLIKSEINEKIGRQDVIVYFTEGRLSSEHIKKITGDDFSTEEFEHDGKYREMTETDITPIIRKVLSSNEIVRIVKLNFRNISTTAQFNLLNHYIFFINKMASNMIENRPERLRWIDIAYFYWNDARNPLYLEQWEWPSGSEEARRRFEQSIEHFRRLQTRIQNRREEECLQRVIAMANQRQLAFPYK